MKKRYKLLVRNGRIYILHWITDGVLFGPAWHTMARFDSVDSNLERCKAIVRLMNECDRHREYSDDRTGDNKC